MTEIPGLAIDSLTKQFGKTTAVDSVSISVPPRSFLALLGPSGCGKTTILRMLAGLESPTLGTIAFDGKTVATGGGAILAPGKRNAGLVFQSYALWPHLTVRQNVEWPLKVQKKAKDERTRRANEVLALLAIDHLADRYPGEISGGQQQRVAIARMLAPSPGVLLFDEPLSNLDAKLRVETRAELVRVHRAAGATSVYVTHDQVEAMTMATHIALMKDGKVEQFGTPEELIERPATSFVATFIGTPPANVVRAVAKNGRLERDGVDLGAASRTDAIDVMYRAESLELTTAEAPNALRAEFIESTPLAGRYVVSTLQSGTRVSIITDERPRFSTGDPVYIGVPASADGFFDVASGARIDIDEPVGAAA